MSFTFEVVIIGGGPAGSTAATLLAEAGWSVALIEKAKFPRRKVCGEFLSASGLSMLERLGVLQPFLQRAGPEIKQIGLFGRDAVLTSPMPCIQSRADSWGRALGREHLDTLLLERAAKSGATVWQPWSVISLGQDDTGFICQVVSKEDHSIQELRSRLIIAAHGSWETGDLPSHVPRQAPHGSDLLGFKAHFINAELPLDLMPLLVFPGGYGGMVHTDNGRLSLSCCIRRDRLEALRRQHRQKSAAEALLLHVKASCRGASRSLAEARLDGTWMAVGPIRPGIRRSPKPGILLVGNISGEAHPIVAEGISMAMQSALLLCDRLVAEREGILSGKALKRVLFAYERDWRTNLAPRTRAASVFAGLSMHPTATEIGLRLLKLFPPLLSWGARWSGKVTQMRESPVRDTPAEDIGLPVS
jgi:flavin-dependent dehydrogenase